MLFVNDVASSTSRDTGRKRALKLLPCLVTISLMTKAVPRNEKMFPLKNLKQDAVLPFFPSSYSKLFEFTLRGRSLPGNVFRIDFFDLCRQVYQVSSKYRN